MLALLHPKNILAALDDIDAKAPSYSLSKPQALRRVFAVLACVCLCLLFIHYAKFATSFYALLQWLAQMQNLPASIYSDKLLQLKR
jgi:hypothetical protein